MTRLYTALRDKDLTTLLATLDPNFVAVASAGMPLEVGGSHVGAAHALADLWMVVHRSYDIAPVPDAVWSVGRGTVIVHGWYVGTIRSSGTSVRPEFVHLLRVDGDVIVELRQITDTVAWGAP